MRKVQLYGETTIGRGVVIELTPVIKKLCKQRNVEFTHLRILAGYDKEGDEIFWEHNLCDVGTDKKE